MPGNGGGANKKNTRFSGRPEKTGAGRVVLTVSDALELVLDTELLPLHVGDGDGVRGFPSGFGLDGRFKSGMFGLERLNTILQAHYDPPLHSAST